jgi:hypothetical protein
VATLARTWRARPRPWVTSAGPGLAVGLGLGILALGPALRRGFLLSYDMVFVPREPFAAATAGLTSGAPRAVPSDAVVALASRVLPADIVQKLILLAIFVLACSGAAALLGREPWFARLAAGVFYAWNPFLAERLIIGQWALLLGYAGLPWALRGVITGPVASWRGAGRLGVALLPAAVGGFAAMTVSALVVLPAAVLARPPASPPVSPSARPGAGTTGTPSARPDAGPGWQARQRLAATAVALAVLTAGSLPWLIPSVLHTMYADPAGVAAFAARADTPFGSFGSLLMLGGIWNAQTVPAGYGGWWSLPWLALVIAAAGGYVVFGVRQRRWPGLGVAAVVGLAIASAGITGPGRDLLRAMMSLWPGYAVLRDGQQFVAPLALAEALGAGLMVAWAARPGSFGAEGSRAGPSGAGQRVGEDLRHGGDDLPPAGRSYAGRAGLAVALVVLLAPVVLLPGLAGGAAGRLRPVWYPAAWLGAARRIDSSPASGDVLLLPWTAYRRPAWNGGRAMLDPWPRLLSRPVVWNDGGQVGAVQLQPDDPAARRLDGLIRARGPLTRALKGAGIRFVIVDSGGAVAGRLPGCTEVADGPGLAIYAVPGSGRTAPRQLESVTVPSTVQ